MWHKVELERCCQCSAEKGDCLPDRVASAPKQTREQRAEQQVSLGRRALLPTGPFRESAPSPRFHSSLFWGLTSSHEYRPVSGHCCRKGHFCGASVPPNILSVPWQSQKPCKSPQVQRMLQLRKESVWGCCLPAIVEAENQATSVWKSAEPDDLWAGCRDCVGHRRGAATSPMSCFPLGEKRSPVNLFRSGACCHRRVYFSGHTAFYGSFSVVMRFIGQQSSGSESSELEG